MSSVEQVRNKRTSIKLNDGKEYQMMFTLNSLALLEERYGSIQAAFDKLEKEQSIIALRTVLFAGLHSCNSALTEQAVGDLIDMENMAEIVESIGTALTNNMPKNDEVEASPNK